MRVGASGWPGAVLGLWVTGAGALTATGLSDCREFYSRLDDGVKPERYLQSGFGLCEEQRVGLVFVLEEHRSPGEACALLPSEPPSVSRSYDQAVWCRYGVEGCPFQSGLSCGQPVSRQAGAGEPVFGCGDPLAPGSGNQYEAEVDYRGVGLVLERHYNLHLYADPAPELGPGWMLGVQARVLPARHLGGDSPRHFVEAVRPDGGFERFVRKGDGYQAVYRAELELRGVAGSASPWRIVRPEGTVEHYRADGRLVALVSPSGRRTEVEHDRSGRVSAVRSAGGLVLGFEYDAEGRLARVLDPGGGVIAYGYDRLGRLVRVGYPDGTERRYGYLRDEPKLTGITDERGIVFAEFRYDANGFAERAAHAGGAEALTVTRHIDTRTVTDARGFATALRYAAGTERTGPTRIAHPDGTLSTTTYDARHRAVRRVDEAGHATRLDYDAHHLLARTEAEGEPLERTTTFEYLAPENDLLTVQHGPGALERRVAYVPGTGLPERLTERDTLTGARRTHAFTYDAEGRLIAHDGPRTDLPDVETFTWYPSCPQHPGPDCGRLHTRTDPLGYTTTVERYDPHGRPLELRDASGLTTTLRYDPRGRLLSRTEGALTTAFDYTPAGDLASVTTPAGVRLTFTYDDARALSAVTDALGNTRRFTYDDAGNLLTETRETPEGTVTYRRDQRYGPRNRLRSETPGTVSEYTLTGQLRLTRTPRAFETTRGYDALGRLTSLITPSGARRTFEYDALDHLVSVTDPLGRETRYTLDALGHRLHRSSPDTGESAFTYDAAGDLLTLTDARANTRRFTYDARNQLIAEQSPEGVTTFAYDPAGRLTTVTAPALTEHRTYDANARLIDLERTVLGHRSHLHYRYDPDGRLAALTYPSGNTVRYHYRPNGTPERITLERPEGPLVLAEAIHSAPFGPPTTWTLGPGLTVSRSLDTLYRITAIDARPVFHQHRTLDASGNPESLTDLLDPARSLTATFDPEDRLHSASGPFGQRTFDFDPLGHRTRVRFHATPEGLIPTPPSLAFAYDSQNRLRSVTRDNQTLAAYTYDPFGQRIVKTTPAHTTVYHYRFDGRLLAETTPGGSVLVEYVYLGNEPLAALRPAANGPDIAWYLNDALATPQRLIDAHRTLVWDADYTPYGNARLTTATVDNNLRFPGQYFDPETGLNYNWHRYYDPATGRHITSDPLGLNGGIDTYGYASQNPTLFIDPLGLDSARFSVGISGLIGGVLLLPSGFIGGGTFFGITTNGQLFVQFRSNANVGAGFFAGVGVKGGVEKASCDFPSGVSTSDTFITQGNFGAGSSIGGSATFDTKGDIGVAKAIRGGIGFGVQASIGLQRTTTIATPLSCRS